MSAKGRTDLAADLAVAINDNVTGDVTPEDIRLSITDSNDSALNKTDETSAYTLTLLASPSASAARSALGLGNSATLNVGAAANTVAAGDDTRFTNSRPPSGTAGGSLAGSYPNPAIAASGVVAGSYTNTNLTVGADGRITTAANGVGTGIGLTDGNKGEITVSGTGTVWTINNGVVTTAKMGGDVLAPGKALLTAADAGAQRTALGLGDSATRNVGVAAGTVAAGDDARFGIASPPTGAAGGDLTGTYPDPTIASKAVTYGKIQDITTTDVILGRASPGAGITEQITCTAQARAFLDDTTSTAQRNTLGLGDSATRNVGTSSGTVAAGDDTRFTNSRPPSGSAGGALSGTYPNPDLSLTGVVAGAYTSANITIGADGRITLAANGTGGGITDGDKGDITVTGGVWTIDDGVVSIAKLGGDITTAGKELLNDANAATQRSTLGLGNSATLDVGTTTGTVAAGDDSRFGAASPPTGAAGGDLTGTYPDPAIASKAVTYAKIQDVTTTDVMLGRASPGAGVIEQITVTAQARAFLDDTTAAAQRDTLGLGDSAVLDVGSTAGTVVAGDDPRLSDSRSPSGAASGSLSGTYPSPTIAASGVTAGSYTAADITVAADGRITAAANGAGGGGGGANYDDLHIFFDGQGNQPAYLSKTYRSIERACTITSATLISDLVGSCEIFITRYTITAGVWSDGDDVGYVTLTDSQYVRDTALTGWVVSLAAGDVLEFEISIPPVTVTWMGLTLGRTISA